MNASTATAALQSELESELRDKLLSSAGASEILQWAAEVCGRALDADLAERRIADQTLWNRRSRQPVTTVCADCQHREADPAATRSVETITLVAPVPVGNHQPEAYIVLMRHSGRPAFSEEDEEALADAAKLLGDAINQRLSEFIPNGKPRLEERKRGQEP